MAPQHDQVGLDTGSAHRCLSIVFQTMLIRGGRHFILRFFDKWPLLSIIFLSRSSFVVYNVVRCYIQGRWNPREMLARWVTDVKGLRRIMGLYNAIICGPAVSHFFDRKHCVTGTLDVFVPMTHYIRLVTFLARESYNVQDGPIVSTFKTQGRVYTVFSFRFKPKEERHRNQNIVIHTVAGDVVRFLSTCATSMFSYISQT